MTLVSHVSFSFYVEFTSCYDSIVFSGECVLRNHGNILNCIMMKAFSVIALIVSDLKGVLPRIF